MQIGEIQDKAMPVLLLAVFDSGELWSDAPDFINSVIKGCAVFIRSEFGVVNKNGQPVRLVPRNRPVSG